MQALPQAIRSKTPAPHPTDLETSKWSFTQHFAYRSNSGNTVDIHTGIISYLVSTPTTMWFVRLGYGLRARPTKVTASPLSQTDMTRSRGCRTKGWTRSRLAVDQMSDRRE